MRKLKLFFILFIPVFLHAQIQESFNDGDFTHAPEWVGHVSNFLVNTVFQLQSKAQTTSTSWLFTPSKSIDNAVWTCNLKINYSTSSANYAMYYVISDTEDLTDGCNGYYIQIGGTNDEISLYLQQGSKKTKIIDGVDKRTDGNPVELQLKLTRSKQGNFVLYSKLATEQNFTVEGSVTNLAVNSTGFVGLVYANTSTTGNAYFFDDIFVTGDASVDTQKPQFLVAKITFDKTMQIDYSEAMDIKSADFFVDNAIGKPVNITSTNRNKSLQLTFDKPFSKGILYQVFVTDITDLAGNEPIYRKIQTGIPENPERGELIFNEIMFNAPENGAEYVEFYNLSSKVIDLSKVGFCSLKSNGEFNTLVSVASLGFIGPNQEVCLTSSPDSVKNYHAVPADANIVESKNWNSLNNESSKLVICNQNKDTIYDELTYFSKWHFTLLTDLKGVSLEKINPALTTNSPNSWHSAATDVNFGTPGYQNSQYRNIEVTETEKKVWCEPETFSPDNNGNNDVCFIRYSNVYEGFVANISVFSPAGEEIATLAKSSLLGVSGSLFWDGKTKRGLVAEPGIYILYFEMFQPQTGEKIHLKLPLAVTTL